MSGIKNPHLSVDFCVATGEILLTEHSCSLKDTGSMIMTSNYQPSEWHKFFAEKESLLCSLDRITDNAVISVMQGRSYRGKKRQILTCEVAPEKTAA